VSTKSTTTNEAHLQRRSVKARSHESSARRGGTRVAVRVLSPITPEQAQYDDRKLSALVHASMAEELREIRRRYLC
jgi:hypothetical protein